MRQVLPPSLRAPITFAVLACVFPLALLHAQLPEEPSWSRQFGTPRFDQANGIAVMDFNVYVAGDVIGALPGQVDEFPTVRSAYVRKYDRQGTVVWTRQFGGTTPGEDVATGVAAAAGAVYVAGWTAGVLPGQPTLGGGHDAFVRKYDAEGNEQWTHQFGTSSWLEAYGVAADASGVYVVGFKDCCGAPLPFSLGGTGADAFLRKYSPEGKELWTRQFGSPDVDKATAVAVDATGVYVTGMTNGEFAGPRGQGDGFLVRFDADGKVLWSRQFGTSDQNEESNAVAVGPSGIYVGGRSTGALLGEKPRGLWDGYVMQFDLDGKLQWTRVIAGPGDGDNVQGLAVGLTQLLVTGAVDGALPGQTFVGGSDAFYRFYDFTGTATATREFGNGLNDYGTGAAVDARAFYIAGSKNGGALGLTPIGDNDAFVLKLGTKPLEKEDVKVGPAPGRGGARGGRGRAGRGGN